MAIPRAQPRLREAGLINCDPAWAHKRLALALALRVLVQLARVPP